MWTAWTATEAASRYPELGQFHVLSYGTWGKAFRAQAVNAKSVSAITRITDFTHQTEDTNLHCFGTRGYASLNKRLRQCQSNNFEEDEGYQSQMNWDKINLSTSYSSLYTLPVLPAFQRSMFVYCKTPFGLARDQQWMLFGNHPFWLHNIIGRKLWKIHISQFVSSSVKTQLQKGVKTLPIKFQGYHQI